MPLETDDVTGELVAKIEELVEVNDNQRKELRRVIWAELEPWREAVYEDGYDDGEGNASTPEFESVDHRTLDALETGLSLLKAGDPQAEVYLDRALQDFGSGYVGGRFL